MTNQKTKNEQLVGVSSGLVRLSEPPCKYVTVVPQRTRLQGTWCLRVVVAVAVLVVVLVVVLAVVVIVVIVIAVILIVIVVEILVVVLVVIVIVIAMGFEYLFLHTLDN